MNKYFYYFFISLTIFLTTSVFAKQKPQLYWNGKWDAACSKCWPSPQTEDNNNCTPSDCILQGFYRCTQQDPPLNESNDPRILSLIKSGLCIYVPPEKTPAALSMECDLFDRFSGKNSGNANKNTFRDKLAFYYVFLTSINPGSQYLLALFYDTGFGTTQNRAKANEIFLANALTNNFAAAEYALGVRYQYGITMPTDRKTALEWYQKVLGPHSSSDKNLDILQQCARRHIKELSTVQ